MTATAPTSSTELEIDMLHEQLAAKDRLIDDLERELRLLRAERDKETRCQSFS